MTIKVKLLTPLVTVDHSYAAGDEYQCSAGTAQALIDDNLAILIVDDVDIIEQAKVSQKASQEKPKKGKKKEAGESGQD